MQAKPLQDSGETPTNNRFGFFYYPVSERTERSLHAAEPKTKPLQAPATGEASIPLAARALYCTQPATWLSQSEDRRKSTN